MPDIINTKKVQGRREVHYDSWVEMLAEAESLSQQKIRTLGNWTYPQIVWHIAKSMNTSIDGAGFTLPAPARWLMSLLLKRRFLTKSLPTGFKTSTHLIADESLAVESALDELRAYTVDQANTLIEDRIAALDQRTQQTYDLLLVDLNMPRLDGVGLCQAVRTLEAKQGLGRTPMVAVTANGGAKVRARCVEVGFDDHLAKPYRMAELVEMVARWAPQERV